jgi:hypothetical protein
VWGNGKKGFKYRILYRAEIDKKKYLERSAEERWIEKMVANLGVELITATVAVSEQDGCLGGEERRVRLGTWG